MITIIHLMLLLYTKKIADHNFVTTIGNTIFKEWGSGLYATGYDVPIIHGFC
jgi:hypothetical protein